VKRQIALALLAVLIVAPFLPAAYAQSGITFHTTAEFDTGTKANTATQTDNPSIIPSSILELNTTESTVSYATTAAFDSGTKASVSTISNTCENVTANAFKLNNTGNYQGIGLTTGTSTCATGAWGINPSGQIASYDMSTLSSGKIKDFSSVGNDGTKTGTTQISSPCKFGGCSSFDGSSYITSANASNPTNGFFVSAWFYVSAFDADFHDVFGVYDAAHSCQPWEAYLTPSKELNVDACTSSGTPSQITLKTGIAASVWYHVSVSYDGAKYCGSYNNTAPVCVAMTGTLAYTKPPLVGAAWYTSVINKFKGSIDEYHLFSRNLTSSERTAIYTDGRSSIASSGSWASAYTETPGEFPSSLTLVYGNVTTNANMIQAVKIWDSSGAQVFYHPLNIDSGVFHVDTISLGLTTTNWSVEIILAGNGSATPFVSSVTVGLSAIPGGGSLSMVLWLLLIVFLITIALGFLIPGVHILCGVVGLFLAVQIFSETASVALAGIVAAISLFMLIAGIASTLSGD
jgi:hypothetical protein